MGLEIENKVNDADFLIMASTKDPYSLLNVQMPQPLNKAIISSEYLEAYEGRCIEGFIDPLLHSTDPDPVFQSPSFIKAFAKNLKAHKEFGEFEYRLKLNGGAFADTHLLEISDQFGKLSAMVTVMPHTGISITFETIMKGEAHEVVDLLKNDAHQCMLMMTAAVDTLASYIPEIKEVLDTHGLKLTAKLEDLNINEAEGLLDMIGDADEIDTQHPSMKDGSKTYELNTSRGGAKNPFSFIEDIERHIFSPEVVLENAMIAESDSDKSPNYRKLALIDIKSGLILAKRGESQHTAVYLNRARGVLRESLQPLDIALTESLNSLSVAIQHGRKMAPETIERTNQVLASFERHEARKRTKLM